LAFDPKRLNPDSSAWRVIIVQSPKHWEVISDKIFRRLPSTDYRTFMLQDHGRSSINRNSTRVKSPALDYNGEALGLY